MGNTPKLRFEGFAGDWERHKLSEISDIITGTTPPTKDKENYGGCRLFVSPVDIQGNRYIENTTTKLTEKGHSLGRELPPGSSLFVSIGSTIGKVAQIKTFATTNQQINAVIPYSSMDDNFVFTVLEKESGGIRKLSATQAVPIINKTTFGNVEINHPSKAEQKSIGGIFNQLDNLIIYQLRRCEALTRAKQFYLQAMFPQKGEKKPCLRLDGFSGDWEQRKLGELALSFDYGLNAAATEYDGMNKYLRITDIDDKSRMFNDDDLTSPDTDLSEADGYLLQDGDILFARTGASVGKSYIYRETDGRVYFAGFLIRAKIKQGYDAEFVFQNTLCTPYEKYIQITSQRSGQPGVNAHEYSEYSVMVPGYEEQKKIGGLLRHIDNLITLLERKVDALKSIKKFLLQNMFA